MARRRAGFHLLAAYLIALVTTALSVMLVGLVFGQVVDRLEHGPQRVDFWQQLGGPYVLGAALNIMLVAAIPILIAGLVVLKCRWRRLTQFMIAGLVTSLTTIVVFCAVLSIREFAPLLLFVLRTLGVPVAIAGEAGAAAGWFYLRGVGWIEAESESPGNLGSPSPL
jgi:hypothetical protein